MTQKVAHPLLFMAFPPLFLLARNVADFESSVLWRPLIGGAVVTALAMGALWVIFRDWHKAGLLASLAVLLFFSQGHLWRLLMRWDLNPSTPWISGQHVLGALTALAYLIFAVRLWRASVDLAPLTPILNISSLCLIAFPALIVMRHEVNHWLQWKALATSSPILEEDDATSSPTATRNIFYVIVDGYSRADNLEAIYGHDNGPFLEDLQRRGFYVAGRARANYPFTLLSVPSALYMDYLPNGVPTRKIADRFRVRDFVRRRGYQFVALATGYSPTEFRDADLYLQPPGHSDEFERGLLEYLPLIGTRDPAQTDRERILYAFDQLPKLAASRTPVFVFAHLVAPHPPYVFARDGRPSDERVYLGMTQAGRLISPDGMTRSESSRRYVEQLQFVNRKILDTVDAVLKASLVPPIIIIQSDHGHLDYFDVKNAPENSYLHDRFSILNAYFLPDVGQRCVWETITPVNTFRAIFNCYFGAHFERLPDRSYVAREHDLHHYVDVTDLIGSEADQQNFARLRSRDYFE
jgi:hypothetical protein